VLIFGNSSVHSAGGQGGANSARGTARGETLKSLVGSSIRPPIPE
jgi:hypothetical protein